MSGTTSARGRGLDVAAAILFVGLLAAPAVDMAIRPAEARDSRQENRTPAAFPETPATWRDAAVWPQQFKTHFGDTFGLRDHLLGARNSLLLDLHQSPSDLLDVGPTGWLWYRADMEFEAQRGTFTPQATIEEWVRVLEERRVRLAARGAHFVFAIAPDKEVIYPEFRPETWRPVGPSLGEIVFEQVRTRTQVDIIDLRPVLRAEKAHDRPDVEDFVYFPRGTHWTTRAACAVSNAILERLRPRFPDLAPIDCSALELLLLEPGGEDSLIHNLYAPWRLRPFHFAQPVNGWEVPVGDVPTGPLDTAVAIGTDRAAPSILLLHDSYGPFVHPYLVQRSSRLRAQWQSWVPELVVDVERPNVVLMIKAERMLSQPPEADAHTTGRVLGADTSLWSLRDGLERARIVGDGRLERAEDAVVWTSSARTDHFVAETTRAVRPREAVYALYDIDAPDPGHFEIWAGERGVSGWPGRSMVRVPLKPGSNQGEVVVAAEDFDGRLLVRIGPAGAWKVRMLEVHASGEPAPR